MVAVLAFCKDEIDCGEEDRCSMAGTSDVKSRRGHGAGPGTVCWGERTKRRTLFRFAASPSTEASLAHISHNFDKTTTQKHNYTGRSFVMSCSTSASANVKAEVDTNTATVAIPWVRRPPSLSQQGGVGRKPGGTGGAQGSGRHEGLAPAGLLRDCNGGRRPLPQHNRLHFGMRPALIRPLRRSWRSHNRTPPRRAPSTAPGTACPSMGILRPDAGRSRSLTSAGWKAYPVGMPQYPPRLLLEKAQTPIMRRKTPWSHLRARLRRATALRTLPWRISPWKHWGQRRPPLVSRPETWGRC